MLEEKKDINIIDMKKRANLKKVLRGGAVIGAGVIGLTGLANANSVYKIDKDGTETDLVNPAMENALVFKGSISANTDFPLIADVANGWFYTILVDVTDNAGASYTNTGQSFTVGDEVVWNGTDWTILGNENDYLPIVGGIITGDLNVNGSLSNYNSSIPDIGIETTSDIRGYGLDYVTDKSLNYVTLGSGANDVKGAMRNNSGTFQMYLNGAWEDIVTNFRFREDANGNYELEHRPIGFDSWIEINSGDSNTLDCGGVLPIIQQYTSSIGPCQVPVEIDGGEF